MSREYDIKDVLIEAGVRDYADLSKTEWTPTEEHGRFMDKLYKKHKSGSSGGAAVKIVLAAAAVAAVIGLSVAIRPVRDRLSAFFGSLSGTDTTAVTDAPGTEPDEKTEPAAATSAETTEPETAEEPKTDEERIDRAVRDMAENGYSKENWDILLQYGDLTFGRLYDRYFSDENTTEEEKTVICAYYSELVRDEAVSSGEELLKCDGFVEKYAIGTNEFSPIWLSLYVVNAEDLIPERSFAYFAQDLPETLRLLVLRGHTEKEFFYDYAAEDILDSVEMLSKYFDVDGFTTVFARKFYIKDGDSSDVDRCFQTYFSSDDRRVRAVISWLFYKKAGTEMISLAGWDSSTAFIAGIDDLYGEEGIAKYAGKFAPVIENYVKDAAAAVEEKHVYEEILKEDYPYTYRLLLAAGYDSFPAHDEFEYGVRGLLTEIEGFYNAVKFGKNPGEGAEERYETDDDLKKASPALIEKVRTYYPEELYSNPSFQPFHSQAEGMTTVQQWYDRYSKILPEDAVRNFLGCENRYFFVVDGRVYTTYYMSVSAMKIDLRTVRTVEKNDGYTVISFNVGGSYGIREGEYTLRVVSDGETMRAAGGTFVDTFLTFPAYGDVYSFFTDAIRSLSSAPPTLEEPRTYYRLEEKDVPPGFAAKLIEYYGSTEKCYFYQSWESVKSIAVFKDRARKYFTEDFVNGFFDGSKSFIEADGTVYTHDTGVSALEIRSVKSIKKLSDTKYEIDMTVVYTASAPGQPTWDCTMTVELISGRPVITGGTLLSDVLIGDIKNW
ncbi:MAG: hypothetical protein J5879_01615 [Clostridia bacterium]|nr:hypothetical protein [Clostridia bacterium]